ncbi:hypothetical protein MtrunA17_Chr3g0140421 [Medicago truncatula]|uniref:Avr9/Cf-9 rapidly elicited protein n=1 Tax=Medicago truncatula TaxID=3880 RepID=G7J3I5_MEDTR|nr:uncharacterized protein LOC11432021 [Medicago truncatula]AES73892.1 Avr9/Cf-9 rapidly elicited protein [Medicago truncatula]RHN70893.1 hypothetical protein MtrunA17_Chr3g0140421 [Medicago truncatula]
MKLDTETDWCLPNNVTDITCMDKQPTVVIEKVSKTVRLLGFLIQNGVSKSHRVMQDMQEVMKRGKNIGKALNNVMVKHHEALTCRPRDADMYFISPLEYQFSCSSSPPRLSRGANSSRRKLLSPVAERSRRQMRVYYGTRNEGRRVKMTKRETVEEVFEVDQAAEEFIERFYRELRLQKWLDHHYHY